eukprot:TRINITY_DN4085_c0_g1_i8.p1 TRINITY_DN4085_c0_g1~~TRINITY_DN4085_c0_g1_i8.p1  ORF type:complete len:546 (+),score=106.19 TRINITY_DN4085_c0_g1_i8:40-1638(+)
MKPAGGAITPMDEDYIFSAVPKTLPSHQSSKKTSPRVPSLGLEAVPTATRDNHHSSSSHHRPQHSPRGSPRLPSSPPPPPPSGGAPLAREPSHPPPSGRARQRASTAREPPIVVSSPYDMDIPSSHNRRTDRRNSETPSHTRPIDPSPPLPSPPPVPAYIQNYVPPRAPTLPPLAVHMKSRSDSSPALVGPPSRPGAVVRSHSPSFPSVPEDSRNARRTVGPHPPARPSPSQHPPAPSPQYTRLSTSLPVRSSTSSIECLFKVVLIGDSEAGKSQLISRYVHDTYNANAPPTLGVDFLTRPLTVDGRPVVLQIWDTAGQEKYRSISSAYYRGAAAALLCFDLTNLESFKHCKMWIKELRETAVEDAPIVLVGTKEDMREKRIVTRLEAERFMRKNGLSRYIETSAMANTNVADAFEILVRYVLKMHQRKQSDLEASRPSMREAQASPLKVRASTSFSLEDGGLVYGSPEARRDTVSSPGQYSNISSSSSSSSPRRSRSLSVADKLLRRNSSRGTVHLEQAHTPARTRSKGGC